MPRPERARYRVVLDATGMTLFDGYAADERHALDLAVYYAATFMEFAPWRLLARHQAGLMSVEWVPP